MNEAVIEYVYIFMSFISSQIPFQFHRWLKKYCLTFCQLFQSFFSIRNYSLIRIIHTYFRIINSLNITYDRVSKVTSIYKWKVIPSVDNHARIPSRLLNSKVQTFIIPFLYMYVYTTSLIYDISIWIHIYVYIHSYTKWTSYKNKRTVVHTIT